jgi:hypothetical protein
MVMCRTRFVVLAVLAVALALSGNVAPTHASWNQAELNDSEQPGSVLVFHKFEKGEVELPFDTDLVVPSTEIEISVTCPKGENCALFPAKQDVFLRAHWVCPGNPNGDDIEDFRCDETNFPLQTTVNGTIYLHPNGRDINLITDPTNLLFVNYEDVPEAPCEEGYLIVWVVDDHGNAIKFDGLIGDAVIREDEDTASGYNALPIQAASYLATGAETNVDNDPSGDLDFDGTEYKAITGKIYGTVRYESPDVETELTLLTLDVKSNKYNNPTTVDFMFFNEDEEFISEDWTFVCWTDVDLLDIHEDLNNFFGRKGLVESTAANKEAALGFVDDTGPVTLIGLVTTVEDYDLAEYTYSLFHDGEAVPTTFQPHGGTNNSNGGGNNTPASSTMTFDDQPAGQGLDGEYQTGVADWGTGAWYVSGPWGGFTTNSISFAGSGVTAAPFAFITPQVLESVQAFNGGASPSTVTLDCGTNPTQSATVNPGELATIVTGWTSACSAVTIGSSNGWDTNFDNVTYRP